MDVEVICFAESIAGSRVLSPAMRVSSWISKVCVVALVAASSACGSVSSKADAGGGGDDVATGDFSITVAPTSLTIPIASEQDVTVTVAPTGSVGDIMLTADGLGTNLEVVFAANPIPAGTTSTTATIRVKGGTPAGTSTITLTGTAGNATHSATVSVTSTTITVSGTVRGGRSGITVGIIGKGSVQSAAGGIFSFSDVTPPYDLYTVTDTGCTNPNPVLTETVYFFDDLTRADPIVTAAAAPAVCSNTITLCAIGGCPDAAVTSARSGAGNGTDDLVMAWGPGNYTFGSQSASQITGTAGWASGNTSTGQLYALQFTKKASGAPDTYLAFARSAQKTLTDGTPDTIPLAFTTVGSVATLTGTVTGPAGFPAPTISLRQEFGPTSKDLWSTTTTTTVDATIPLIANAGGTNLYVSVTQNSSSSSYVHPLTGNTTVNFTMPAPAVITSPAADATGVTNATPFTWTPGTDTISEVIITTTGATRTRYRIFTTAGQITIPMIPEAPLPGGQTYTWSVDGYGPYTSVNEAAAANELETTTSLDFSGPAHAWTRTPNRGFTTP